MSQANLENFIAAVANVLEIAPEMASQANLSELEEYDSMGRIEVALIIEQQFNFEIDYEVLDEATSFRAIFEYCQNKT